MRILHVGGQHCVTSAISKYQIRQGHEASILGNASGSFFDSFAVTHDTIRDLREALKAGKYDFVNFHQADTLAGIAELCAGNGGMDEMWRELLASQAVPVFFSYGTEKCPAALQGNDGAFMGDTLTRVFKHVFIGNGTTLGIENRNISWSWLPTPIDLDQIPVPEAVKIGKGQQLKVVHVRPAGSPEDSELIDNTVQQLKEKKYKFSFELLDPDSFNEGCTFQDALGQCDLLIEQVYRNSFGVLALQAMAHGKTVISCNQYGIGESWNNLRFSPVIDSNPNTFLRKLEAVIREPLCLRDLSLRSRAYVERYHHCEVVVAKMVEKYREMLS